ncbi:Predicted acetyltransferase [Asanoa hainanensis]|uniref:Predicted acetyltransferase n=1 Tax=Asanoa hainanensis TaxID=560556 RepID=A0A239GIH0_9ACTN|nr:Predicted acetyltransferase [Asanoa hainanensis]
MPALQPPTVDVHRSFLAAMTEFQAEGRGATDDQTMIGSELREYGDRWAEPGVFAEYVAGLRADEETPRRAGFVPATTLWWVDGDTYLGRLAIRHRLTEGLRELGGHIGYDVRSTARRRGHATAMLRAALPITRSLGIVSALVTCDVDNVGSRKVIEANGGVFEDERAGKLRFWVPTAPVGSAPVIYKLLATAEWRAAEAAGVYAGSDFDRGDGFIHFSGADQVVETAARVFAGQTGLTMLAVDPDVLGDDLRWEASRGGALFPHLYAPMPLTAVVAVIALRDDIPVDEAVAAALP